MNIIVLADKSAASVDLETSRIVSRLERLPMTGYQRRVFAIIASAWLVDQVDVALLTFLLGSIVVAFDLTPAQAGQLAAMTFAGQLVGNLIAGTASDKIGRRAVFQITMLVCELRRRSSLERHRLNGLPLSDWRWGWWRSAGRTGDGVGDRTRKRSRQVHRLHGRLLGGRIRSVRRDQLLHLTPSELAVGLRCGWLPLVGCPSRSTRNAGISTVALSDYSAPRPKWSLTEQSGQRPIFARLGNDVNDPKRAFRASSCSCYFIVTSAIGGLSESALGLLPHNSPCRLRWRRIAHSRSASAASAPP